MTKVQRTRVKLQKLNLKYLQCHLYGHAWDFVRDEEIVTNTKNQVIQCTTVDQCLRCTMLRWAAFRLPSWSRMGNYHYDPPVDYYIEVDAAGTRVSRDEVRAEYGRRRNRKFKAVA